MKVLIKEPFWETKHEWRLEDMRFEMEQIEGFTLLVRKHTDDEFTSDFKDLLKACQNNLKKLKRDYKKIYGVNVTARVLNEKKA